MDLNCYSILRCLLWNCLHQLLPISMSATTAIHTFQLVTPWSCSRKRYFGFFCDNFVRTMYNNWEKIQCTVFQLHKLHVYPKLDSWFNFWYVQCTAYVVWLYGRTSKFFWLDGLLLFCIIMGLRSASSAINGYQRLIHTCSWSVVDQ